MKKNGILNGELTSEIAMIGHTQYLVISDVGLPAPKGVKVIDLALSPGIPNFMETLRAVMGELVCESYLLADEIREKNGELEKEIHNCMGDLPVTYLSHEKLKELTKSAQVIVRTGETSPYANIVMTAGVNF